MRVSGGMETTKTTRSQVQDLGKFRHLLLDNALATEQQVDKLAEEGLEVRHKNVLSAVFGEVDDGGRSMGLHAVILDVVHDRNKGGQHLRVRIRSGLGLHHVCGFGCGAKILRRTFQGFGFRD